MKKTISLLIFTLNLLFITSSLSANYIPQVTLSPPPFQENETATDLYVWRHGETDSNVAQLLSGGGDIGATLTDKGQKQAIELAKKIANKGLDLQAIYSSDLPRAMQTALPVLEIFSPEQIPAIISAPQLREILHGQYELLPANERNEKAALQFMVELEWIKSNHENIQADIQDGILDRFYFWKIHPITGQTVPDDVAIKNVESFIKENCQEPETAYELLLRAHAEFVRIAEEAHENGYNSVGLSTHGGVLTSLINTAQYGDINVFVPIFYQSTEIQIDGNVVMPMAQKVDNGALMHFRYWHTSKQLEFCGSLN